MDHNITSKKVEAQNGADKPVDHITKAAPELLTKPQAPIEQQKLGVNASEKAFPNLTIANADGKAVEKEHKVQGKDNLWKISEAHLKNRNEAHNPQQIQGMVDQIVALNKPKYPGLEKNPHKLDGSMTLALPQKAAEAKDKQGEKPKATDPAATDKGEAKPDTTRSIKKVESGDPVPKLEIVDQTKPPVKAQTDATQAPKPADHPHHSPKHGHGHGHEHSSHPKQKNPEDSNEPKQNSDKGSVSPKPEQQAPKPEQHNKHKKHDPSADMPANGESIKTIASWYHEGTKTAEGKRYNPDGLSAASKTLPFGTLVEVHNLDNGKTITVPITDRGPYVKGRQIDMSRGAARQLGMIDSGIARVEYKVVGKRA